MYCSTSDADRLSLGDGSAWLIAHGADHRNYLVWPYPGEDWDYVTSPSPLVWLLDHRKPAYCQTGDLTHLCWCTCDAWSEHGTCRHIRAALIWEAQARYWGAQCDAHDQEMANSEWGPGGSDWEEN